MLLKAANRTANTRTHFLAFILLARKDNEVADQNKIRYLAATRKPVWMADKPFKRKNIGRKGKRHPRLDE
jgi:hypothetical protein